MTYVLLGADGRPYESDVKGQWGGHRGQRIYGRLDCPSALRAIARGGYVRHRVFFADEATAIAVGYRPCAVCCPREYQAWKAEVQPQLPRKPYRPHLSLIQAPAHDMSYGLVSRDQASARNGGSGGRRR